MAIPVSSISFPLAFADFAAMYDWNSYSCRTSISSVDHSRQTIRAKSCDGGERRRNLLDWRSKGRTIISCYRPNQDGGTTCRAREGRGR